MGEMNWPGGWTTKVAAECFDQVSTTGIKVKTKDCKESGLYPVIDQGRELISGFIDDNEKLIKLDKPVIVFGDHTRNIKWVDFDFVPGADGTKILSPKGYLLPRVAFYELKNLEIPDKGYSRHFKFLKELEIPIPPLAEQKIIADKLDTLLAQVETTKARLERIPEILKTFRQSVLAAAVSGRLTEKWREDKDTVWQSLVIDDIGEVKGGKRLPKGDELVEENTGFPYIRAGQLKHGTVINTNDARSKQLFITPETQAKISRYTVNSGDLYITIVGASIGDAGVIPEHYSGANLTENAAKITQFKKPVKSEFLSYWLRSQELQDLIKLEIKSGAQGKLALKRIKELPVPYTDEREQTEIVRRVEELLAFANNIEQKANAALERVNNLTQSILAKAFRGELTADWRAANADFVNGENSAESLLKKITTEQKKLLANKPRRRKRCDG